MRNLLSIDGGGIRGFYALQILQRVEQLLREKLQRPGLVLADYFDYMGGTSTGAVIAAMLSWGRSVAEVIDLYRQHTRIIFGTPDYLHIHRSIFSATEFSEALKKLLSEDGEGRQPALLGTARLRTRYLCVMRNATTGSSWVVTNARGAKFNDPALPDCNLNIPLYQLVRASSAVPFFFPPESIGAGDGKWVFLDGCMTPYTNPAFLMYLTATLPCYGDPWPDGCENMRLISVGTGRYRARLPKEQARQVHLLDQAEHLLPAIIDSGCMHQDLTCRAVGRCLFGEPVDMEVGNLLHAAGEATGAHDRFLYCRYNHEFTAAELEELPPAKRIARMDDLEMIPFYLRKGEEFANACVKAEHLTG